jgi:predicted nucleic acid-binding protein
MKSIFVDTSALIALGNKGDYWHQQAIKINNYLKENNTNFITTNAILLEFANAFSKTALKPLAISMIKAIISSNKWDCIFIDEILFYQGFTLYETRKDKEWGLVDCTSIIVAQNNKITDIFTGDYHFEQAGFTILLK